MNDAIDSRLEALAFQYVSFGLFTVASNLWTLVAVVTAAVSMWSIRAAAAAASSSAARSHRRGPTKPAPPHGDGGAIGESNGDRPIQGRRQAVVAEGSAPTAADDSSTALTSSADYPGSEPGDGVTRGRRKFTAYYKDDGERKREAASTAAEEEDAAGEGGSCGGGEWWESWERVLKARNGEMWWYRCQDTGVINGAVVRLWDESRCGSGRRDSSGCAVW